MTLYSHIFTVEQGQYPDYALGFLEVSCKVVVILSMMTSVTLLENFQGFRLASPLLVHSLWAHSLLAHFLLANFPQDQCTL